MLLATFDLLPEGEGCGHLLPAALDAVGVDASWAVWSDPEVDWAAADLVAIRSTWDYHRRLPAFLAWARRVERDGRLLGGAAVVAWNADKAYLVELAERLPVVPTELVDADGLRTALVAGLERHGTVVLKPRTGAGGTGVVVAARSDDPRLSALTGDAWLLQPLVPSVRTAGERSLFVLDGRVVSQVDKLAAGDDDEVRVHPHHGGVARPVDPDPAAVDLAERTVALVALRQGAPVPYGRVDLLEVDGTLCVSEVEVIEPGLYLDLVPGNATAFAATVVRALAGSRARPGAVGPFALDGAEC